MNPMSRPRHSRRASTCVSASVVASTSPVKPISDPIDQFTAKPLMAAHNSDCTPSNLYSPEEITFDCAPPDERRFRSSEFVASNLLDFTPPVKRSRRVVAIGTRAANIQNFSANMQPVSTSNLSSQNFAAWHHESSHILDSVFAPETQAAPWQHKPSISEELETGLLELLADELCRLAGPSPKCGGIPVLDAAPANFRCSRTNY